MNHLFKSHIIATGLAMFSMFFGAGNIIYPLVVGKIACDKNIFSIAGFLISAVGIPFLGLIAIILFNGDYKSFFYRIGKIPGFILMITILGLLGPLGVIPRCIILSHEALSSYIPDISLLLFSIISAIIIFICTIKEKRIIDLLGRFLSPLLLACLTFIILKGLIYGPAAPRCEIEGIQLLFNGFIEGYKTLDLFAALFFSATILAMIKKISGSKESQDNKKMAVIAFKSSIVGASLLGLVYLGMSFVTARYSSLLSSVPDEQLFISIARHILGDTGGIIVCLAVILACLTTAIALTAISAEFIEHDIFFNKLKYQYALLLTLLITIPISTLQFNGVMKILIPFLKITYPAMIVLVIVNSLYKLWGFKIVRTPFYTVFVISFCWEYAHIVWPCLVALLTIKI